MPNGANIPHARDATAEEYRQQHGENGNEKSCCSNWVYARMEKNGKFIRKYARLLNELRLVWGSAVALALFCI